MKGQTRKVKNPIPLTNFTGKNYLCKCGSGKPYKVCCEPLQQPLQAKITALDYHIQSEIKKILVEAGIDHKSKDIVLRSRKADFTEKSEIYYHAGKYDILKVNFLNPRMITTREQKVFIINSDFSKLVSFESLMINKDGE